MWAVNLLGRLEGREGTTRRKYSEHLLAEISRRRQQIEQVTQRPEHLTVLRINPSVDTISKDMLILTHSASLCMVSLG